MPLNAVSHAEDLALKAGKPSSVIFGRKDKRRRGWKGFYGSVHDVVSQPCLARLRLIPRSIAILAR